MSDEGDAASRISTGGLRWCGALRSHSGTYASAAALPTIQSRECAMTIFDPPRGKVIDAQGSGFLRLLGLGVIGLLAVILLFSAVTRVDSGHVGVLTLFGKVTPDVLAEGLHLINPLKATHELSVRTQELKETASVPSSEGLVLNLDTSLIYHLNPEKAAAVYQKIGPNYVQVLIE